MHKPNKETSLLELASPANISLLRKGIQMLKTFLGYFQLQLKRGEEVKY